MKINSKSRTYKFTRFYLYDQPHNLCQYTRQIIGATILTTFFVYFVLVALLLGLYPFFYPFDPNPTIGLAILGMIIDGFALVLGYRILKSHYNIPDIEIATPEYDSVLSARLRAAHDKVCPLIEVE